MHPLFIQNGCEAGRPPLPVGTFGKVTFVDQASGSMQARAKFRPGIQTETISAQLVSTDSWNLRRKIIPIRRTGSTRRVGHDPIRSGVGQDKAPTEAFICSITNLFAVRTKPHVSTDFARRSLLLD